MLDPLKEQYNQELLATFKALPPEEEAAMMPEMTGEMVEEGKEEEEGHEVDV